MNIFKYINILFNGKQNKSTSKIEPGEHIACKYIKKQGYKILEKNYRTRYGEIDIVAVDSDVLCFVEVKSRKNTDYGFPEDFVDKRKQQKLIKTSLIYSMCRMSKIADKRFDVVTVNLNNGNCNVIKNAFEVII